MFRALLTSLCLISSPAAADDILVFAAASLKTALDQIAEDWNATHTDQVIISYAGSGVLAHQINQFAPADVYVSANAEWMDAVQTPLLERVDLLSNALVVVGPAGHEPIQINDLPDLLGNERLAMALINAVPAGQYGKAAFEHLNIWDDIAPHVAQTDNVRSALAFVALGEAPFGVVYASDAMAEPKVDVVATFDPTSHPPIIYPAGLLTEQGRGFFDALSTPAASDVFRSNGFRVLN